MIAIPSTEFLIASTGRTEGIPEHAIEISGPLIEIGQKNRAEWGILASATEGIIAQGVGIPVRVCNNIDPHACDLAFDSYSNVGYVTEMWDQDGWIHARAAITTPDAAAHLADGTWMPFGVGSWSIAGLSGEQSGDFDGMVGVLDPLAIALFTPPDIPAYAGSKFDVVAAAVAKAAEWTTAFINSLPDSSFAYIESCYGKTSDDKSLRHLPYKDADGNIDIPHIRNALARVDQLKMTCEADKKRQDIIITSTQTKLRKLLDEATKTAAAPNEPKVTMEPNTDPIAPSTDPAVGETPPTVGPDLIAPPPIEGAPPADPVLEATTYTQEDLDDAVKIALEKQKIDFDAQISKMTPNDDLPPMFASMKSETIDEIKRAELVDTYVEMVTASAVLSAPYRVDGKIDAAKMTAKRTDMMAMATATVEQAITDAEVMVAAVPTGKTQFDATEVASKKNASDTEAAIKEFKDATGRA